MSAEVRGALFRALAELEKQSENTYLVKSEGDLLSTVLEASIILRQEGDPKASLKILDFAKKAAIKSPWIDDNRARALVDLGQEEEALEIWRELSNAVEQSIQAEAIKMLHHYASVTSEQPTLINENLNEGSRPVVELESLIALRARGENLRSLENCNQLASSCPTLREWALDNKARALVNLGRRVEACEIWRQLSYSQDEEVRRLATHTLQGQEEQLQFENLKTKCIELLSAGNPGMAVDLLTASQDQFGPEQEQQLNELKSVYFSSTNFANPTTNSPATASAAHSLSLSSESAMALCVDADYCSQHFFPSKPSEDSGMAKEDVANFILDNYTSDNILNPSAVFDLAFFGESYGCNPTDAPRAMLSDTTFTKCPSALFHTSFVQEYYQREISLGGYIHPYLFYLDHQDIYIHPQQFIKGSRGDSSELGQEHESDYWNYSRAVNHLHSIYSLDKGLIDKLRHTDDAVIHVLVPAFDVRSISAGFFGVFALARLLSADLGKDTRSPSYLINLLFVDDFTFHHSLFSYVLSKTTGLEDLLSHVSYSFLRKNMAERHPGKAAEIGIHDLFVASVWYTAAIAKELIRLQGSTHQYLYLIQDYEAGFYPRSSHFCLAEMTYDLTGYAALVSSEPLYRQLMLEGRISKNSIYFQNASAATPTSREDFFRLHNQKKENILMLYGRPNVNRNMFEITILSLMMAYRAGTFEGSWKFYSLGLGSVKIELSYAPDGSHQFVEQIPRMTLSEYEEFIKSADICLTLMASPHPSLLPFDFSGNGTVVVTNSFQSKDQEFFNRYSELIISAEPDPPSVSNALALATSKIADLEWRYTNRCKSYPTRWEDTWSSEIKGFLRDWIDSSYMN